MEDISRHHWFAPAVLGLLILAGLVLRLHAVSPYLVYPDSYQNLVAAEAISRSDSIMGSLGPDGSISPSGPWRVSPLYASGIAALAATSIPAVQAGQIISLLASLLSIPLVYLVTRQVWRNRDVGLIAAVLLALSFSATVWSGFVLAESLGMLMLLASLFALLAALARPSLRYMLLAGLVLGAATWTDYAYLVVVVPAALLAAQHRRLRSFVLGYLPGLCAALLAGLTLWRPHVFAIANDIFSSAILSSLSTFIVHELPLFISLVAAVLACRHSALVRRQVVWIGLGIILLLGAQLHIHDGTERPLAHLLPLLVILGSYGAHRLLRRLYHASRQWQMVGLVAASALLSLQLLASYHGVRDRQGGAWFRPGYEAVAATRLPPLPQAALVVAASPEAYYLATHHSVRAPAAAPPYLTLPANIDHHRPIIIVADESLRNDFPAVYGIVTSQLTPYLAASYTVQTPLLIGGQLWDEENPVRIYRLPADHLPAELLNHNTQPDHQVLE